VLTLVSGNVVPALMPLVVGLLAAFVAYSRWRLAADAAPTGKPTGILSTNYTRWMGGRHRLGSGMSRSIKLEPVS
jgi:hypothetical protein